VSGAAGEFDLIARIRARAASARGDVVLGIGDDAAVVSVPAGQQLVVATDTLNVGVHFPDGTAPADIGWKALAVNLSDLAAMGATPAWCTLSLSMPQGDAAWVAFPTTVTAQVGNSEIAIVGRATAVLVRRGGRWLIAQNHLSVPAADQATGQSYPDAH